MKKFVFSLLILLFVVSILSLPVLAQEEPFKVGFITTALAHSVPAAWHEGILAEIKDKPYIDYEVADGQWKADVQIAKMEDYINREFDAIIIQAQDAAALTSSVKEAEEYGTYVIVLNLDVTIPHSGLVTMVTVEGGRMVAKEMAKDLNEEGNIVIIQGPPGASIAVDRERGFREELKNYPNMKIIAAQPAEWQKEKAFAVMQSLLQRYDNIDGVYGINDSMAEGAALAAEKAGRLEGMSIWGLDGEKDALTMIEEGKLTGTIYTNCYEQGASALRLAEYLMTSGISTKDIKNTGVIQIAPVVVRKENVGDIKPEDRW
jgi:ribose transport system substrate-binding protein